MSHVCDVDSHFVVAVFKDLERKRIVKVFCICRVDGECKHITEVPAALAVLVCDLLGDSVGSIGHVRLELVRKCILGKDRVHLRVVLSRLTKHVNDVSAWAHLVPWPIVHHSSDLHSRTDGQFLLAVAVFTEFIDSVYSVHIITERFEEACLVFLLCDRMASDLVSAVTFSV